MFRRLTTTHLPHLGRLVEEGGGEGQGNLGLSTRRSVGKPLDLDLATAATGGELLPLRSYVNISVTTWGKSL